MKVRVQSATEAKMRHLENASIATTEKTATRQVKRQGDALTAFFIQMEFSAWNSSQKVPL